MVDDLFSTADEFTSLAIHDADLSYMSRMNLAHPACDLLSNLIASVPWRADKITVWGKTYPQPRLVAWYADKGLAYTYSGIRLEPLPWSDTIQSIRGEVERVACTQFNSVLLNYYRDHNDSMGFHSDDEPELGPTPIIASVSLGEQRTLVLKHKTRKDLKLIKILLESGSLLVMKGLTQRHWKHGINKESTSCGARINLTFRRIVPLSVKATRPFDAC